MSARNKEEGQVRIDCDSFYQTAKAIRVNIDTVGEVWFPLSTVHQIHPHDEYIVVDAWKAKELGLA